MADTTDPRLDDESRLAEFRRVAAEIAADAPTLARIAIEGMIRNHNPLLKGTAGSAGRAGRQSGNVSELTAIATLKPGGADRLRRIFNLTGGNFDGAQKVSTLHDMRFVLFDDDTRILFATAYDGDWDTYINDFATKIPELMDLLFANIEGWPGIASAAVKDFIADHQIDAAGWFVANPQVTVVDVRRLQRMETALDAFLDSMASNTAADPATRDALALLSNQVSVPPRGGLLMGILQHLKDRFRPDRVTLQLDDIQALILRARPEPYVGIHAMLHVDDAAGGRDLLRRLAPHIPAAADWTEELTAWTGVAISHAGLKALGVPNASLASFPLSFRQGMAARADQLRDAGENAPEQWEEAYRHDQCHIALTIFASDQARLDEATDRAMSEYHASSGVTLIGTHRFGADADAKNPFGFRDSVSQPTVAGAGVDPQPGQERAIAPGEFILGENSETGAPLQIPHPDALGRNGSYVVLRKYDSRPGAFNDFVRGHAKDEAAQELLAAKMFGRWRSGAPLILSPTRDDEVLGADPSRRNEFDFSGDKSGTVCPHGAHMRRLNPRGEQLTILTDENIHRIIRRSSTFGPRWSADLTAADDSRDDRGIFFIFISARAFDTIEFLQQEWINRGNFIDLGDERDPIVGLHDEPGRFTIPAEPARSRIDGVTTFNRLRGGEYMFMPSLTALRWIAAESWN